MIDEIEGAGLDRSYVHRRTGLMTDPLFMSAIASLMFSALYVFL
jgi:hypothetical protein